MKRFLATILLAGALVITPVLAQESAAGKSAETSESSSEKPGMEIWKWINFAILAGVLGWMISKNVGPMLASRTKQIQDGLAAGERARADAEVRAAAVQARLANLGTEVEKMRAGAREEREREVERIRRDAQAELQRIRQHTENEIESMAKQARLEVQRFAAKLAIDLAEQKVRARMSPEIQAALLSNFTGELSSEATKAQV
jgi:F-type H+-transporting ATPase subunit b